MIDGKQEMAKYRYGLFQSPAKTAPSVDDLQVADGIDPVRRVRAIQTSKAVTNVKADSKGKTAWPIILK